MEENISEEKAIKRGKKVVHLPTYTFFFTGFILTFLLTSNLLTETPILKTELLFVGFILTIILTILLGNKLISK